MIGQPALRRLGWWALLGVLVGLVAINLPELGSSPWPFRPPFVHPTGPLAPLVRAAGEKWDVGIARAACFAAGLLVAAAGVLTLRRRTVDARLAVALVVTVAALLMLPSTLLAVGLRQSTEPWFFTNDSTYQIELGGQRLLDGHDPYGSDYSHSGLERFYTFDGTASERVRRHEVALRHFAYFPGTPLTGGAWRLLPRPLDDYRLFVALCTLLTLAAALLFRGPPLGWRLAIGALMVANPIAIRSAWFGQNDAPSLLLLVLAFALVTRERFSAAAAAIAGAVLLKQFAIVAVPFLALMIATRGGGRAALTRAGLVLGGVLAVAILPFLAWHPGAFIDDTVKYGAGTYRIVGYGLSAILVRLGIIGDRDGTYPFALIAVLTWLPLTLFLLREQWRAREQWLGPVGFAISIMVLLFIGRTFNNYYLVWPLMGVLCAALVALGGGAGQPARTGSPDR